jgi:molecular chaperone DnaJ
VHSGLALFPFLMSSSRACPECDGAGVVHRACAACAGRGTTATRRGRLRFDIPAGVPPGGTLRIRGQGRRARNGRRAGDLVVEVTIDPHPLFEPAFPDLRCEMPISIFRALAGGRIDVPAPDGDVVVTLPDQVRDGTQLRVAGRGMRNGASGARGDVIVVLRVVVPRSLSEQQREWLAKLDRIASAEPALAAWARRRRDAEVVREAREQDAA